jgi:hypothetical protein
MTYSTGQVINNEDYNNFVWGDPTGNNGVIVSNNLNYLWGPGLADRGINQDMTSLEIPGLPGSTGSVDTKGKLSPVNEGDTVEAQSWIGFFAALNRLRYYQDGATGNLALSPQAPGVGRLITTFASVSAKLTSANTWYTAPDPTIGVQTGSVSATRTVNLNNANYAGTVRRQYSCKVQWPTGDHARWFFNAGGQLRIGFSASTIGNPATDRSAALVSTIQGIGECYISAYTNSGFSGNDSTTNSGTGKGYWTLDTSSQQLGKNTLGAGTYSDSYITCWAYRTDTTGNGADNGAVGKSIVIVFEVSSGFGSTGALPAWATDNLDVQIGIAIDLFDQTGSGSTVSKTWSNPTVGTIALISQTP